MKNQFLFSLILAILLFTPSFAEESIIQDPISALEELHNLPPDRENNPEIQKVLSELMKKEEATHFANAPEPQIESQAEHVNIEDTAVPSGIDSTWE